MPSETIPIKNIRQDLTLWPRACYDEEALIRYRESIEKLPPIIVDRKSRILLDGFHRVKVYEEAKREEIPVIYENCSPKSYLLRALELNLHGAPIPIEQRNAIIVRMSAEGYKQEDIAKACGISQGRLSQILATYNRDTSNEKKLSEAISLVDSGHSLRQAEQRTGVKRSTLERAVLEAKSRQEVIRKHIQERGGLSTVLRYPDRGPWGKGNYLGNSPGFLLVDIINHFKPKSVFDPMEGSGTTREVCRDLRVEYEGRDLKDGFDLLSSALPKKKFDLVFWHPPYWPGFQYSNLPNDLSNTKGIKEYLGKMHKGFSRLRDILPSEGRLVILIGDGRKDGVFYPIHSNLIEWGLLPLQSILIKDSDHERRAIHFRYGNKPFIPMLHEYVLIFQRG